MSGYGGRRNGYGAASAYRQSRVLSSTPVDLVVMLYERLLADLRGAANAVRSGDIEAKAERVQRANDVLFELLTTLDRDRGGEVAERLAALYGYMITRVGESSRKMDAAGFDEVAGHVEPLLAAWSAIAREPDVSTASAPPPPGR